MVDLANSNKDIGLINPSSNNIGQHKGELTIDGYAATLKPFKGQYIEMGSCVGFCMLVKREIFEKAGYLDEVYRNGNFDDTDYSRKIEREGYLSVRAKGSYVYHYMKSSFLKVKDYEETFKRNQAVYNRRWGKTKRLLYIVTKKHGKLFDWIRGDVLKKARGGNWIWLFFYSENRRNVASPEMPAHSNIKIVHLPPIFFEWNCLIRILKKKKRFDSIFVDDSYLKNRIKRFDKFHKAETILMGG